MYALTGANGQLGRRVLHHLRSYVPLDQVIALTRIPAHLADGTAAGVTVRRADFTDPATLPAAFVGVTRLLLISTDDVMSGKRAGHHQAAVAAGVAHIVYTSFVGADASAAHPITRDHGLTEAALAASGVAWTALRNNAYAEALPYVLGLALSGDQLVLPRGEATTSWVTRDDCAQTAAGVLVGAAAVIGTAAVTGPDALGWADVAERLSAILGRPLTVQTLAEEEMVARFVAAGVPRSVAARVAGMLAASGRAGYGQVTDTVTRVTGRPATPIDGVLRSLAEVPSAHKV